MAVLRSQLVLGLLVLHCHDHHPHHHQDHLRNQRRSWAVLLFVVAGTRLPLGLVPLLVLGRRLALGCVMVMVLVLEQPMMLTLMLMLMLLLVLPLAQGERPQPGHAQQPQSRRGHERRHNSEDLAPRGNQHGRTTDHEPSTGRRHCANQCS